MSDPSTATATADDRPTCRCACHIDPNIIHATACCGASPMIFKPPVSNSTCYTEGVCGDGAAILRDGTPMTISDILATLNFSEVVRGAPEVSAMVRSSRVRWVGDDGRIGVRLGDVEHVRSAEEWRAISWGVLDLIRQEGF